MMVFHKIKAFLKKTPAWVLRAYIGLFSALYLSQGDVVAAIIFAIMFLVSLLPILIDELYNIKLHWVHDLSFSFLIFAHMAGFSGLYNFFAFWDDIAHILGIMIVTMISFSFFYAYELSGRIKMSLPMVAFFSACFAMAIGGVWEITEFIWDNIILFSINYGFAQNGLLDTMTDLTWDLTGAIIASMLMIYYIRKAHEKDRESFFDPFIRMIVPKKN